MYSVLGQTLPADLLFALPSSGGFSDVMMVFSSAILLALSSSFSRFCSITSGDRGFLALGISSPGVNLHQFCALKNFFLGPLIVC